MSDIFMVAYRLGGLKNSLLSQRDMWEQQEIDAKMNGGGAEYARGWVQCLNSMIDRLDFVITGE